MDEPYRSPQSSNLLTLTAQLEISTLTLSPLSQTPPLDQRLLDMHRNTTLRNIRLATHRAIPPRTPIHNHATRPRNIITIHALRRIRRTPHRNDLCTPNLTLRQREAVYITCLSSTAPRGERVDAGYCVGDGGGLAAELLAVTEGLAFGERGGL